MHTIRNVLIAADGSPPSRRATKAGIAFAQALGARVTACYAMERAMRGASAEKIFLGGAALGAFEQREHAQGAKHLARIARQARAAHVPCDADLVTAATVCDGIVAAARRRKCDVIFMGSHGRGALAALILGSVTREVLSHTRLPVVVYR